MQVRRISPARVGVYLLTAIWFLIVLPMSALAAPYADYVIDARTGEVLHATNADTRLHPASLTKMMTLYIAFQAVQNGEIGLDDKVTISRHAASEPPSKLGLKAGQKIALRYLIRAAAIKSANDAATAIGEAIEGSEAAFARRMTRTAQAMGMSRTTFKNAHGLTESGHLSTAHDMTTLGRHVIYDYPQYYNLFSRQSAHAGMRTVTSHNRLLTSYKGADGIKTGYTNAAGFNLVASAERGSERVIATVFGGKTSRWRDAKVAELLDVGFRKAPSRAPLRKPDEPSYVATAKPGAAAGKTIRLVGAVTRSLRPQVRTPVPVLVAEAVVETAREASDAIQAGIDAAVAEVKQPLEAEVELMTADEAVAEAVEVAVVEPEAAPVVQADQRVSVMAGATAAAPVEVIRPAARPDDLILASTTADDEAGQELVTRVSTSGGRLWGINVGRYGSRYAAEKVLLRTALAEMSTLDGSLRKVVQSSRGFDANFLGMTRESADLACRRLQARNVSCFMIGPS